MTEVTDSPLLERNTRSRNVSSGFSEGEYDIVNEAGNMGYSLPTRTDLLTHRKLWELNYQEAAIFLQEGENNDKFYTHPRNHDALPAYQMAHHRMFYLLDLFAALLLLFLACCERPAVPFLTLPVGVHGSLEIFGQLILALELGIRLKWLGFKTFFKHKRTLIKSVTLSIMFVESVVVLIRQTNHFRVTRALRPLFLLDTHYCRGVRRTSRQILQSLPPILDMIFLLLFFMLIFSILGFYLFSRVPKDTYFTTIQDSFISLFILLTTANYPDVMMPAYTQSRWNAAFFIVYLALELYFLMNLLLAVVYDTFSNLEKSKVKRLFFHKRVACQHAFKLLVTKKDCNQINIRNFSGMMNYLRPKKSIKDSYLIFKVLNTSKSGRLSLDEFYEIYSYLELQWKTKSEDLAIWSSDFKEPFKKAFQKLYSFVNSKYFDYFISFVIAANFVWILTETIQLSRRSVDVRSYNFTATWASVVFVCIYTLEAVLKILAKGPEKYFTSGWDLFDFLVTVTSVIGLLGAYINESFYYVTVLRPFRLLRLFKIKRTYRDILGTLFVLFARLTSLMIVICLVYYFFAIIGMEVFIGVDLRNCCKNTSVEDFYQYTNETNYLGFYYLNNFENILISGVTLFELTVVNNWFIIMEGYAKHVSEWTRIYFMSFYLVMMVVMTIVVAFILEMFLFRIQYRRELKLDDFDDHAQQKVKVYLSNDERTMLENPDHVLTGHFIVTQANQTERELPHMYMGKRYRSKDDFKLRMYSDEVKKWIEEDQNQRNDTIQDMTELRHRRRPNAELEAVQEEAIPRSSFSTDLMDGDFLMVESNS